MTHSRRIAIVGAGMAGVTCARTLGQAGHQVTVFEKSDGVSGRMATHESPFGTFDHGAQYFTVRDARFATALATVPGLCKPWSANAVRVLDELGRVAAASLPAKDPHWVPRPAMSALVSRWAQPLSEQISLQTRVTRIERDPMSVNRWQLRTEIADDGHQVFCGFDAVLLAMPAPLAHDLLASSKLADKLSRQMEAVKMAPCWTLMLAFPNAMQPGLSSLGPQWNAARSTHHRMAWLARESSKPGRKSIERWTVQASAAWSQEHLEDDHARVEAKLLKGFAEVTGIRAQPAYTQTQRWRYAKTEQALGVTHLWDAKSGIGACGDWCIGHRVEDAFISGLELALQVA
ncbi:NAD(P)/FAD-dependent oxidoreductase [Rhodoferax sp.]|uniref:NAD(P)/FAD-dependent oxidoreductase n=1 Tax=Rhodoferax sp. TaxID=50421 RepID=UPI00274B834D|nr:FAD-dependent oxidoreductase [Rhodoferax sp.]